MIDKTYQHVSQQLLVPAGLTEADLENALKMTMGVVALTMLTSTFNSRARKIGYSRMASSKMVAITSNKVLAFVPAVVKRLASLTQMI